MRKQLGTRLVSLVLAAALAAGIACPPVSAQVSDEYQKQLDELNQKLKEIEGDQSKEAEYQKLLDEQISELNAELAASKKQIDTLNSEISDGNAEISRLDSQILAKQQEIDDKTIEIERKEAEKADTLALLKKRMRASYMTGQTSSLDVLLSSKSFGDFLSNMEYIRRIADHDRSLADTLEQQANAVTAARTGLEEAVRQIETDKADKEASVKQVEAKRSELLTKQEEQKATADQVKERLKQSKNKSNMLDADYSLVQQKRAVVQAAKEEAEEELRRLAEESSKKPSASGDFIWPLPGHSYISSPYGYREGTFSGNHTGIDIPAPSGTSIIASRSGTVQKAYHNETPSYGKYVVIDHGGGDMTLYAHCSKVEVNVGDQVVQGQEIAEVGSTGDSTGPHLHFEVYIGKQRQNPELYVSY